MSEWDIDREKVSTIITDNCSNMVAAFKEQIGSLHDESEDDAEAEDETEQSTVDYQSDFLNCESEHDDEFILYNRVSCFSHTLQLVVNKFQEIQHTVIY